MAENDFDEIPPGTLKRLPSAEHYEQGMRYIAQAEVLGVGTAMDAALVALAHAFLGGLAGELEYRERMDEEKARVAKPQPPEYAPIFEEDENRP
jgi:hypothetical protein